MRSRHTGMLLILLMTLFVFTGCVELMEELAYQYELEWEQSQETSSTDQAPQTTGTDGSDQEVVTEEPAEPQDPAEPEAPEEPEYLIGDTGPAGGIVFYDKGDYSDGWRYLETAAYGWYGGAADPLVQWGAYGYEVGETAKTQEVGQGRGVTLATLEFHEKLIDSHPDKGLYALNPKGYHEKNNGSLAAMVTGFHSGGGYDDWYLMTTQEATLLYENFRRKEFGDIMLDKYWCSTEESDTKAYVINFYTGGIMTADKYETYRTRPIRKF